MELLFLKSNFRNIDFKNLVVKLDEELAVRDGEDHSFYHQFNSIDHLQYVIVVYAKSEVVGCGAIKPYGMGDAEIKRMYIVEEFRGQRIATKLLNELENWAKELNFTKLILETGVRNPEAIAVYNRCGYSRTPNYDQYLNMENSVCFAKELV